MFWDFFFSLLFLGVVIYLFISLFVDMIDFEWDVLRWFRRTFRLCNHPYGREYRVKEYLFANEDEHPHVIYETRCGICHKETGVYVIDVEDIIDIDNLRTVPDKHWHCMNMMEFSIIQQKGTKVD